MTDVSVAGPEPAMFHATNIALHAANVALLLGLVAAALFAVHPLHRAAEALPHFATAVRRLPDWESARLNYAMALAQTNQPGEAIRQFEEVLRISPSNAVARRALGK